MGTENMKEINQVRTLEYFCCMIGSTAHAWSRCVSRSDGEMLRGWFSCTPSVASKHGVKGGCSTKALHKGYAIVFFVFHLKKRKGQSYMGNWLPIMGRTVCHIKLCITSGSK
jgi:hypothetical protein